MCLEFYSWIQELLLYTLFLALDEKNQSVFSGYYILYRNISLLNFIIFVYGKFVSHLPTNLSCSCMCSNNTKPVLYKCLVYSVSFFQCFLYELGGSLIYVTVIL